MPARSLMRYTFAILLGLAAIGFADSVSAHDGPVGDLRNAEPDHRVTAVRLCGDTYYVTTEAGELPPLWEYNLRFAVNSSDTGPGAGRPAIVPAGMLGDRAMMIFANPSEVSAWIDKRC